MSEQDVLLKLEELIKEVKRQGVMIGKVELILVRRRLVEDVKERSALVNRIDAVLYSGGIL